MANDVLHQSRARKAWPILVERANSKGQCFTYREIGDAIGVHWRAAGLFLSVIQEKCKKEKWPKLQALAVNALSRVPGKGYEGDRGKKQHEKEIKQVQAKPNWPTQAPF